MERLLGGSCDRPLNMVVLNVYDMVEQNYYTAWAGLGIFHSGVEVYGQEFAFGGHEYAHLPGVFVTLPREAPGEVSFREAIQIGTTDLTMEEVQAVIHELGHSSYKGRQYHLLQKNCNTFSDELCFRLTGNRTPAWVNRLASIAVALHCLLPQGVLPPLLPPTAIPQSQSEYIGNGTLEEKRHLVDDSRQMPRIIA